MNNNPKGLVLYESITGHTVTFLKWLTKVMSTLDPPVELVVKDITNACAIREDAPEVFGGEEQYNDVSFIIVMGPIYCFRADDGLTELLADKDRFNLPENLQNTPMFGWLVGDGMSVNGQTHLFQHMKKQGYKVRKCYSNVSPLQTTPKGDVTLCEEIKATATDICKIAQLDESKENDKAELESIEKSMKEPKFAKAVGGLLKQGGMMCRVVGHHKCKIGPDCIGCGKCVKLCMRGVLSMSPPDDKGKKRAVLIRPKDCIGCGRCYVNCPVHAILKPTHDGRVKFWVNNEFERLYGDGKKQVPVPITGVKDEDKADGSE